MSDSLNISLNLETPRSDACTITDGMIDLNEISNFFSESANFESTPKIDYSIRSESIDFTSSMSLFMMKNEQTTFENLEQNEHKEGLLPAPIGLEVPEQEEENFACPQVVNSENETLVQTPKPNEDISTETSTTTKDNCLNSNTPPPFTSPTIPLSIVTKYQSNCRKYKPDSIRKKIKSRTLKKLKNIFNTKILLAGGKVSFDYFPQNFVSNVKIECNKNALLLSLRELYMKDFGGLPKDREKLRNNQNVIKYLDEHPEIMKKSNFDELLLYSFKKILVDYFYSFEFTKDLERLREEKEDNEYINKYQYIAFHWAEFYENNGKILNI